MDLYSSVDGSGLKDWGVDGSNRMTGYDFVQLIRVRCRGVQTKTRSSRGTRSADVKCDKGCHAAEKLKHISQK